MTNPTTLRHHARHLHDLYLQLDQHKTYPPPKTNPTPTTPNPTTPGGWATTLAVDTTYELHELVTNIITDLYPDRATPHKDPYRLCQWIRLHADTIATTLTWADDLVDNLDTIATNIQHHIDPTVATLAARTSDRYTAPTICAKARQRGHTITSDRLRKWVERGKITVTKTTAGHNLYSMSEVLDMLTTSRNTNNTAECHSM